MREDVKQAILSLYKRVEAAKLKQKQSGKTDQGERKGITSGHHLDPLLHLMKEELTAKGFNKEDVFSEHNITLPGWFRATKDWDLVLMDGNQLVAAIELKTINSSFGNNCNNRTEEALGSALDFDYAVEEKLLGNSVIPPVKGYVLIVRDCPESAKPEKPVKHLKYFTVDPIFDRVSYQQRFQIVCERFRKKSIYNAVWFVVANPETGEVSEPSPEMNFEKFIATIVAQLYVRRA
jgi:type II restriction enzyme